jgi:putative ABC transport system permease protein
MSERRRARAERIYERLVRLFPADFRDRFGLQLLDLFRDQHRAARAQGRLALVAFWARIIGDAFISATAERARRRPLFQVQEGLVQGWPQDIRHAVRTLVRRPAVSLVIIATLALGIGANTAIFSVVNTVLLRRLPYPHSDRLVRIWEQQLQRGDNQRPVAPGNFFDWKPRTTSFEDVGWSRDAMFNITGDGSPETVIGYRFSANMLQVLGVAPRLGRGFTAADDAPGAPKVVILSHGLWERRYGRDPAIVGRALTVNGEGHTVIGVMPPEFKHPARTELWAPIALPPATLARRDLTVLRLVGRLKPRVTPEDAHAELNTLYKDIAIRHPDTAVGLTTLLTTLDDPGDAKPLLAVLFGAVGFVLLIACANVANLLLADATARRRELAVRRALGASRSRVIRQMLTESVLLALIGGGIGVLVTWWTRDALLVLFPENIANLNLPRVEQIDVSAGVFAFAFLVSVATGLLFGLLPAWHISRVDLQGALKEGDRGASPSRRTHATLVVAEVALSIVLLVGALLMVQSFWRLQHQRLGFDADRVLSARLNLPRSGYPDDSARAVFGRKLVERLRLIPGVEAAGLTNYLPLSGWWGTIPFDIEGMPKAQPGSEPSADFRVASDDYFRSMGISLVAGRSFTERDDPSSPRVIIVNQTFVKRYLPGGEPIGKRLVLDLGAGQRPYEIVGVIGDVKSFGLEEAANPDIFFSYWQVPFAIVGVSLRTSGDPASLASPLRAALWSIDRDQPITHLLPMSTLAAESLTFRRTGMTLAASFGLVAVMLAAIGIYGVVSYSVSRRTREIGIRLALGATRHEVGRLMIREGLMMASVGIVVGVAAALALSRFLRSVLYEVRPADPLTYVVVSATLLAIAVLSTLLPARRASAVDPITALRME